jgi:hypothetical protein
VRQLYAFMTTEPNEIMASINHERMPVLLEREEQFETWRHGFTAFLLLPVSSLPVRCAAFGWATNAKTC